MDTKVRPQVTEDGSLTVQLLGPDGWGEAMHSRVGALKESLYIYSRAVRFVEEQLWPLHCLSVGLGIGYNDLILAAHLIKSSKKQEAGAYVESFEANVALRQNFMEWFSGQSPVDSQKPLFLIYDEVVTHVAKAFKLAPADLKGQILKMFVEGRWKFRAELDSDMSFDKRFSLIFYDAFSSNENPELWQEDFLTQFISQVASSNCVLSTYAATGNLNRALRSHGFLLESFTGFGGKREATFAVKATEIKKVYSGGSLPSI